jgi:hypothetical protein
VVPVAQVPLAQEQLVGMALHRVHSVSQLLVVSVVNLRRAMAVTQAAIMPVVSRTGKVAVAAPVPVAQGDLE